MPFDVPEDKKQGYNFFLRLLQAGVIHIAFSLVALVSFAFGHVWSAPLGFLTLLIGTLVVLVDLANRSRFVLSLAVLAAVVLVTAANVS